MIECPMLAELKSRYPKGYDFQWQFDNHYVDGTKENYFTFVQAGVTNYALFRNGVYVNTWRD